MGQVSGAEGILQVRVRCNVYFAQIKHRGFLCKGPEAEIADDYKHRQNHQNVEFVVGPQMHQFLLSVHLPEALPFFLPGFHCIRSFSPMD